MTDTIGFTTRNEDLQDEIQRLLKSQKPLGKVIRWVSPGSKRWFKRLVRVSWASELPEYRNPSAPPFECEWSGYLVFVAEGTPPEALGHLANLKVQDPTRLQLVSVRGPKEAKSRLDVFLHRLATSPDSEGILHAWCVGEFLEVTTTGFRRLRVAFNELPGLHRARPEELQDFEVGYDGSYLHWPALDVHLGFEQLEGIVDPAIRLRKNQESTAYNQRYGAAIRALREEAGLTQSDIEGLSAKQVGRIERGEQRATSKALATLATAHGLSPGDYLQRVAERV